LLIVVVAIFYKYQGTILRVLSTVHLQTAPAGRPADPVGIVMIERLFTKVAHTRFAVIQDPTIIASSHVLVLFSLPPKIAEQFPDATFKYPPLTVEWHPEAVLLCPPKIAEQFPLNTLPTPPPIIEKYPETVLLYPPTMEE
jgi:hypothetical protein